MPRRRRRRRREGRSPQQGWVDRLWAYATDTRAPGVLLLVAGIVLATTPWTRAPEPLVLSWWDEALYLPDALSIAAGFAAVAVILLLGALLNRYRLAVDANIEVRTVADAEFEDATEGAGVKESRLPGLAWAGGVSLAAGIALLVGGWFGFQRDVSPARVPIAVGETIESYTVPYGAAGLDVMLPLRVRLDNLEAGEEPSAHLQIFEVGEDPGQPRRLQAGAGLDLDGIRLTFVGMRPDVTKLRAVFRSQEPDSIAATASEGDSFQLQLDGPRIEVLEITRNYLGVMGPAARVRTPDAGEFWVFQRQPEGEAAPELGHSLELVELQSQPAALLTVSPDQPFWPLSLGGTLFVLGFSLLIVFPERIVRRHAGKVRIWSFNDGGRVAEEGLEGVEASNEAESQPRREERTEQ